MSVWLTLLVVRVCVFRSACMCVLRSACLCLKVPVCVRLCVLRSVFVCVCWEVCVFASVSVIVRGYNKCFFPASFSPPPPPPLSVTPVSFSLWYHKKCLAQHIKLFRTRSLSVLLLVLPQKLHFISQNSFSNIVFSFLKSKKIQIQFNSILQFEILKRWKRVATPVFTCVWESYPWFISPLY